MPGWTDICCPIYEMLILLFVPLVPPTATALRGAPDRSCTVLPESWKGATRGQVTKGEFWPQDAAAVSRLMFAKGRSSGRSDRPTQPQPRQAARGKLQLRATANAFMLLRDELIDLVFPFFVILVG